MEHSGEFSESTSDECDYSDCDEQGDKSDPEPYNYTADCYIDDGEDHGHHTNGSGISWHNAINIQLIIQLIKIAS